MEKKLEVLCVDDEPMVVEGLKLHLRRRYVVHTATSGADGLSFLQGHKDIAVVLSDMRMPGMDGAKFLSAARQAAPAAVRMLLTGHADMQSAMAAVNEGQIFRFISKPCPPEQLIATFEAAETQHKLIIAEKVLLQQTLLGCVESLAKVLSLTKPAAFGRALRLRSRVRGIVHQLQWQDQWQIEAAAILSQLGAVTLSEETLMRLNEGEAIDSNDRAEIAASIDTSMQLLENIPRLEPVLAILSYLKSSTQVFPEGVADAPAGGLLLRIVLDADLLEAQGYSPAEALVKLEGQAGVYDAAMLETVRGALGATGAQTTLTTASLSDLQPGMVLAQDLVRKNGVVILPRGFEIDRGLLEHIRTFAGELAGESVKVIRQA